MKAVFLTIATSASCLSFSCCQDKETAWSETSGTNISAPYVYGMVDVPPNFSSMLAESEATGDDPFADEKIGKVSRRFELDKVAPVVPQNILPTCLPARRNYRDVSSFLNINGIELKDGEWAVLGGGLTGTELFFCTSAANAEVIEQLFNHSCRRPVNLGQLTTLVSIKGQGLSNIAPTVADIEKKSPVIHSRYGHQGRSGETVSTRLITNGKHVSGYRLEPTIGENYRLLDCRLDYTLARPEANTSIAQKTAITKQVYKPAVLDCGTRGKDGRHYFLIIHSRLFDSHAHSKNHDFKPIQEIEGIYKMKASGKAKAKAASSPFFTRRATVSPDFLQKLRNKIEELSYQDDKDPFDDKPLTEPRKTPPPPIKVTPPTYLKNCQLGDKVFDVSPHLEFAGLYLYKLERIYFNQTRNEITCHGYPGLTGRLSRILDEMLQTPRQVRITADIVQVDREGLNFPDWTIELIEQSNSNYLTKYSVTARSGEKGVSGKTNLPSKKAPQTEKDVSDYTYELEGEPTIWGDNKTIDIRFSLKTKPLGKEGFVIEMDSTVSIIDGKPAVIELGHPNSSKRTHLLILNADIITPDGSFYRDCFKPVR